MPEGRKAHRESYNKLFKKRNNRVKKDENRRLLIHADKKMLLGGEVAGVVFPFGDESGHIGREIAIKVHLLSSLRMYKAQSLGMQGLAGTQFETVVDELGIT